MPILANGEALTEHQPRNAPDNGRMQDIEASRKNRSHGPRFGTTHPQNV